MWKCEEKSSKNVYVCYQKSHLYVIELKKHISIFVNKCEYTY